MERELVTIRNVNNLTPIEGADFIELAHIDGWQVICKKGSLEVGKPCVYFEIDSFLPIENRYEFLRKSSYKNDKVMGEGFRIKTMKMRGVISQGLALPLSEFPEITEFMSIPLTQLLKVKKWDKELSSPTKKTKSSNRFEKYLYKYFPFYKKLKGYFRFDNSFPTHLISKTSAVRIQNIRNVTDIKQIYEQTLKLHGTSLTVIKKNNKPIICSRNQHINPKDKSNIYLIEGMKVFNKIKGWDGDIAIQGELCGPSINSNTNHFNEKRFFVFNIKSLDDNNNNYFDHESRDIFCNMFNLEAIPLLNTHYSLENKNVETVLEEANVLKSFNSTDAEGFVLKPIENPNQSIKVISNKFLLKNE